MCANVCLTKQDMDIMHECCPLKIWPSSPLYGSKLLFSLLSNNLNFKPSAPIVPSNWTHRSMVALISSVVYVMQSLLNSWDSQKSQNSLNSLNRYAQSCNKTFNIEGSLTQTSPATAHLVPSPPVAAANWLARFCAASNQLPESTRPNQRVPGFLGHL